MNKMTMSEFLLNDKNLLKEEVTLTDEDLLWLSKLLMPGGVSLYALEVKLYPSEGRIEFSIDSKSFYRSASELLQKGKNIQRSDSARDGKQVFLTVYNRTLYDDEDGTFFLEISSEGKLANFLDVLWEIKKN